MKMQDSAFHHADQTADVSALIKQLSDESPEIRTTAAWELRNFPTHKSSVVPALVKALDDPNENVSANALLALGNLGAAAKAAAPELMQRMQTADGPHRFAIFFALEVILGIRLNLPAEPYDDINDLRKQMFPPFLTN